MIRSTTPSRRSGFTLIELLVVIMIIGILIALLVPAIAGAVRTARNAAVTAEMSQMAQALADFKSRYGDFPPSRILLREDGFYNTASTAALPAGTNDMNYGQLAQRSLNFLRKAFPRASFSTSGQTWNINAAPTPSFWHDFNGDGQATAGDILLQGDECLFFFLAGIPSVSSNGTVTTFSGSGFGKNPSAPFVTNVSAPGVVATINNANATTTARTVPMFEFRNNRLGDPDGNGVPSYFDSLGTNKPFIYFSAYGGGLYDPNDVNFVEQDDAAPPVTIALAFRVNFLVQNGTNLTQSPAPNPYTSSLPVNPGPTVYHNAQSFQIISAGSDGLFGVGGAFVPAGSAGNAAPLPNEPGINSADPGIRAREKDNLGNFSNGKLD